MSLALLSLLFVPTLGRLNIDHEVIVSTGFFSPPSTAPALAANGPRVLETSDEEILIELATDDYSIEDVVHGGESYNRVRVSLYGSTAEPGLPRLPRKGVLLGVPFGAELSLEVVSVETEALGRYRVEPAPFESIVSDGEFSIATEEYLPNEEFYARLRARYEVVVEDGSSNGGRMVMSEDAR